VTSQYWEWGSSEIALSLICVLRHWWPRWWRSWHVKCQISFRKM